jgi:acyl-CoA synthetase (AMP-forming)/AMP-acid ligase II
VSPLPTRSLDELLSANDRPNVASEVATMAGALRAEGVEPGDVVVWQLPNSDEAALLYRACWRLDAVAAPVHHRATPEELATIVDRVAPRLVVGRHLEMGIPVDDVSTTLSGPAAILFTAGSSGAPKGVRHTRVGLAYKAALMVDVHGLTPDDAVLMPAPMAHVSGLLNGVLVPGAVPCRTVWMERWDPELALVHIESARITFMVGPPTFFVSLWQAPGFAPERVASLRLISSGGAGVTEAFCREATDRLGARVKRTYGSTEAPTIATSLDSDPVEMGWRTDGHAIGDVGLRIDDATGELLVLGPELFAGYLDERETREAFTPEGWFRTGDLATIDADGWLTITGRLKDVIIRGGENIATGEVESVLEAHPAVSHAVAVGYPDDLMGERVCAFVVATEPFDLDACRAWFAQQGVAKFKTPERVVQVDTLPLLVTGKPDRVELRKRAAAER